MPIGTPKSSSMRATGGRWPSVNLKRTSRLLLIFDAWLYNLAINPPCGPTCGEGGCTNDFLDDEVRAAVVTYLLRFCFKSKKERYQTIIEWVRQAKASGQFTNEKYVLSLPHAGRVEVAEKLRSGTICLATLWSLFGIERRAWSTIKKNANTNAVAPDHGNKGKVNGRKIKDTNPILVALKAFMSKLEKLGEPRATRFVREEVGQTTIRDHADKGIWLPMICGMRAVYYYYAYC